MEDKLTINGLREKDFLTKYNHTQLSVSEIGLDWNRLVAIFERHRNRCGFLSQIEEEVQKQLKDIPGAYIVRSRVKDPEHLIDKIIRKEGKDITEDNYIDVFDDLIGCRILHLFKSDWKSIHQYMTEHFEQNEQPVVYYRKGDPPEYLKSCEELGIKPVEREAGYRSIHYVNKFDALGRIITYEVQVRTMIEDAWSEIDHLVRYPNHTDNELINKYLLIFNAFAGAADEMGTFLMLLKQDLTNSNSEFVRRQEELNQTISELKDEIASLKGDNAEQKAKINQLMEKINFGITNFQPQIPDYEIPSFVDVYTSLHKPSIQNSFEQLQNLRTSIEESLANTKIPDTNQFLGAIPNFEMPKAGYPLPKMDGWVWSGSPKKRKK